jgi:Asp-tRNA(Asn)/Glu-tRNA(Gln) amidotransferase A subunit family amidase
MISHPLLRQFAYLKTSFSVFIRLFQKAQLLFLCGEISDKLPISVQILGKHFDEETVQK